MSANAVVGRPILCHRVDELRALTERARARGARVAVVPTMGALHRGHVSLIECARAQAELLVVTIFVNPTQFGPNEDLARYPRTLPEDLQLCAAAGVDVVFAPESAEMYPPGDSTRVNVTGVSAALCGASRPGHFAGVATIVTKLLVAVGPCAAIFGRKDYQQLKVIERLVRDLLLPCVIVPAPTLREADGLALSSRNVFLTPEERRAAQSIPRALTEAWKAFAAGERRVEALRPPVQMALEAQGLRVDYVSITDPETIAPYADSASVGARALLALAAFAGKTRLIDNLVLGEDAAPLPAAGGAHA